MPDIKERPHMSQVNCRLNVPLIQEIDKHAEALGSTRSVALRDLLMLAIRLRAHTPGATGHA